ncbi:MAG: hypothetical protein CBB99_02955 [Bacteroidetes bacterium TMED39]|nr:MAG: hypothetical protein CBB99_02955 [Bacteroidetes bacterium TMED39]
MGAIKLFTYLPILFMAFTTCGSKKADQLPKTIEIPSSQEATKNPVQLGDKVNLGGSVENFTGLLKLSKISQGKMILLDTVRISDKSDKFSFHISFDEPTLCYLTFAKSGQGLPVILSSTNKLELKISYASIPKAQYKGEEENAKLSKLFELCSFYDNQMTKFNEDVRGLNINALSDSSKQVLQIRYQNIQTNRTNEIAKFIGDEAGSLASYFAVTYLFEDTPLSMLNSVYSKMKIMHPASQYTEQLAGRIENLSPLEVGAVAPEITLKTPSGKELKLSSLRGKMVLIDFWASWCRPCRAENPKVKVVYDKYKSKGFEIYGVSLDNSKSRWLGAIEQDGLSWKHVSDLKGWKSIAAQKYKITSIPNTYLIDREGKIIAKGLRAYQLDKFLEKNL